jgi:hypothetical protein
LDYIAQVSIDGGNSWYQQAPVTLQAQPAEDGQKRALIPLFTNKKLLQIKLRDFPKTEGLNVPEYSFSNTVKIANPNSRPSQPARASEQNPPKQTPNQKGGKPTGNQLPDQNQRQQT